MFLDRYFLSHGMVEGKFSILLRMKEAYTFINSDIDGHFVSHMP